MPETIKISSTAQNELEDSAAWYEEQLQGLGVSFANVIYDSLNKILKNPEAYQSRKGNSREFVVDKFPFIVVYRISKRENAIYILHIFHTSRSPKRKYRQK